MIPEFSAISAKTNQEIELPKNVVWSSIRLEDDQLILYISEEGEFQYITKLPFDEEKMYKVILFDYSSK